jgi:hypothetical protein
MSAADRTSIGAGASMTARFTARAEGGHRSIVAMLRSS